MFILNESPLWLVNKESQNPLIHCQIIHIVTCVTDSSLKRFTVHY